MVQCCRGSFSSAEGERGESLDAAGKLWSWTD